MVIKYYLLTNYKEAVALNPSQTDSIIYLYPHTVTDHVLG